VTSGIELRVTLVRDHPHVMQYAGAARGYRPARALEGQGARPAFGHEQLEAADLLTHARQFLLQVLLPRALRRESPEHIASATSGRSGQRPHERCDHRRHGHTGDGHPPAHPGEHRDHRRWHERDATNGGVEDRHRMPTPRVPHSRQHLERQPYPPTPSGCRRAVQRVVARTTRPRRATAPAVPRGTRARPMREPTPELLTARGGTERLPTTLLTDLRLLPLDTSHAIPRQRCHRPARTTGTVGRRSSNDSHNARVSDPSEAGADQCETRSPWCC
jgi:hypothetical protein